MPASIRLMDNLQFRFGQALKPRKTGVAALKSQLEKWLVTGPLGYDPERMVACTLLFEGNAEVERERAALEAEQAELADLRASKPQATLLAGSAR